MKKKIGSGNILDINGKVVGRHKGYYKYTLGQRKGVNVSRLGKNCHSSFYDFPDLRKIVRNAMSTVLTGYHSSSYHLRKIFPFGIILSNC
ncbi:MAG: hypothetical protein K6G85_03775 [Eubacterium sp.]|nr:hypothetical protein [Eubacterium sp.]